MTTPAWLEWLAALPALITEIGSGRELELHNPYLPGGHNFYDSVVKFV